MAQRCRPNRRVYPHVCGGTQLHGEAPPPARGLSPRVRGNRRRRASARSRAGSIPACAGEPASSCLGTFSCRVYPRVCGGTSAARTLTVAATGLSPRVRGNHAVHFDQQPLVGSIPACAGEPAPRCPSCPSPGVYPRVCGGTMLDGLHGVVPRGLSPRVRGNPKCCANLAVASGSIPACAGEP